MVAEGWHAPLLLLSPHTGWKPSPPFWLVYERVVRSSTGMLITLLFSLSSITGSVRPNRQSDRARDRPTNLTAPPHHKAKSSHHIKVARERHQQWAIDAAPLLCHFCRCLHSASDTLRTRNLQRKHPGGKRRKLELRDFPLTEWWVWVTFRGDERVIHRQYMTGCLSGFGFVCAGVEGCFDGGWGSYSSVAFLCVWLPLF